MGENVQHECVPGMKIMIGERPPYTILVIMICCGVGVIYWFPGTKVEDISGENMQKHPTVLPQRSGEIDSKLTVDNDIARETSTISETLDVLILFWSNMHDGPWYSHTNGEPLQCKDTVVGSSPCDCRFTKNKALVNSSSAVIWDLVAQDMTFPSVHKADQYWILFNSEYLSKTNDTFPYKKSDVFNLSAEYHEDADIHLPYGMCRPRDRRQIIKQNISADKNGTCLALISECNDARSLRLDYIRKLNESIPTDIIGLCGRQPPNTEGRSYFGTGKSSIKRDLLNSYQFYLAFENTLCKHYITEKVFKVLQDDIHTVPIVRGFGPYKDMLPPHSYIDTADFATTEDLARYLKLLVSDPKLYFEYFRWRETTECVDLDLNPYEWPCIICNYICKLRHTGRKTSLKNFDMFQTENNCFYPKDVNDKP